MKKDRIKIKYDGRYLQAYMPNGELIPAQVDLAINNNGDKDFAEVVLSCEADISHLTVEDNKLLETIREREHTIKELERQLKETKSASFWDKIFK